MDNQEFTNNQPVTIDEILSLAQNINDLNKTILDRYIKAIEFLETKGLDQEFGKWYVEKFESDQNKELN